MTSSGLLKSYMDMHEGCSYMCVGVVFVLENGSSLSQFGGVANWHEFERPQARNQKETVPGQGWM